MSMQFVEQYETFNQFGVKMPYKIVKNGSSYLVVDLEPQAGIPPVPGVPGGYDLPTIQAAVNTHASTYRPTRLNTQR
jgi:hypothetical protein